MIAYFAVLPIVILLLLVYQENRRFAALLAKWILECHGSAGKPIMLSGSVLHLITIHRLELEKIAS